jgi:hypothetical protein
MWCSNNGRRTSETGKFRTRARLGTVKTPGGEHRDWSYRFISHSTGASIRRSTFNVTILDPYQNQVAYLRNFPNIEQAAKAAREWIDQRLSRLWPKTLADLGKIPAVPEAKTPAQEK